MPKKIYYVRNLDCANCAAKIEKKINQLPQVKTATLVFSTGQLRVTAEDPDAIFPLMGQIVQSVEPEARLEREQHSHDHDYQGESLWQLLLGIAGFVLGLVLTAVFDPDWIGLPAFAAAYLVLGWQVLKTAGKNLIGGHLFDENFLMSLATLGAFAIGEFPEAVGVMLFYRVGEYFEHKAVDRSRSQIMEAVDLRPERVLVAEGEAVQEVPPEEVSVGQILLIRPGDRIGLDGVVVSGSSFVDTAPVTGEPLPVEVKEGDPVISGCVNGGGTLLVRVEKVLSESMVSRILNAVENAAARKPRMDRFITRFSRIYTPVVVAAAVLTALLPPLADGRWEYWIYTALSFLVMSCPCALVLSIPLTFFAGIGAGSRRGILFKGGATLEAMAGVRHILLDKTGTLTSGSFQVQQIIGSEEVLALCAGCEQGSTHPIAKSIVAEAKHRGVSLAEPANLEELSGYGIRAQLEGRQVLCGSKALLERFAIQPMPVPEEGTQVYVAAEGKCIGCITVRDSLKPDGAEGVRQLKNQGRQVTILTGDAEAGTAPVAEALGVEAKWGLLPEEKLQHLEQLRSTGQKVMFVGDGINDAPVLAGADVGGAMGSGSDAAIEAADVVFLTGQVTAIADAFRIARHTRQVARQNLILALGVKLAVMALGLFGFASMWLAVFADSGVALLCVLNSLRVLYRKKTAL